jgi:predicted N-acyltransferase
LPSLTYSAHHIRDPGFRLAIRDYVESEKEVMAALIEEYATRDPYRF